MKNMVPSFMAFRSEMNLSLDGGTLSYFVSRRMVVEPRFFLVGAYVIGILRCYCKATEEGLRGSSSLEKLLPTPGSAGSFLERE
jgi:hypothetical protein